MHVQVLVQLSADLAITVLRACANPLSRVLQRLPPSLHTLALRAACSTIDSGRCLDIRHLDDPTCTLLQVCACSCACMLPQLLLLCMHGRMHARACTADECASAPSSSCSCACMRVHSPPPTRC
jgi:hypothetical protein